MISTERIVRARALTPSDKLLRLVAMQRPNASALLKNGALPNQPPVSVRYSKPLNIREHKREWLNLEYLRKLHDGHRKFCEFVKHHPQRRRVERCYVCGSTARRPFGMTYGIPYVECTTCTHVFAEVVLSPEDLAQWYRDKYATSFQSVDTDRTRVESRMRALFEPKLRYVADFIRTPRRRWLDVGAGNGGVVACARAMGFEARGLELGKEVIEFARQVFGLELIDRSIYQELSTTGPESYDIISFLMVLEHIPDPADQVACASRLLSPGGLLVVEVPLASSVSAMTDITFPDQPLRQLRGVHIMNYTVQSLRHLVEHNELEVAGLWFFGQDIFNLVLHLALQNPGFLDSKLCRFFLDHNDALQAIVDRSELSDEVILVARKP